jgi:parvulin-like peptidyl-prolyl isomerase
MVKYFKHCPLSIILLIFFVSNCTNNADKTVAQFGNHKITLSEFRIAYLEALKQPKVFDSRVTRENFLDELINRKLLAEAAQKQGLDQDERLQFQVAAYKNKCLRDEHYRRIIEPKVKFDEDLLKQTYIFTREQRRIKHLFFENKVPADSAYHWLLSGKTSFDELATILFKDTTLANSGGDLGWVDWDQMEFDLANAAFNSELNSISKPVRSTYGYHILKVVDWKKNPLISEPEYQQHRDNTSHLLKLKMGEKIAFEYIEQMMNGTKIQVRSDAVRFVGEKLQQLPTQSPTDTTINLEAIESVQASLWDMRNEPIIYIDNETITIGQFIANLAYLPRSALKRSYKTVLDYSIRDFKLTQQASDMGLEKKSETVQLKTKLFEEYRLQIMLRKKIIDRIKVTDEEIKQTYQGMISNKNLNIPFEEYREVLARNILKDKKATEVPELIKKLREGLTIQKNVQIIHEYYDSISNN